VEPSPQEAIAAIRRAAPRVVAEVRAEDEDNIPFRMLYVANVGGGIACNVTVSGMTPDYKSDSYKAIHGLTIPARRSRCGTLRGLLNARDLRFRPMLTSFLAGSRYADRRHLFLLVLLFLANASIRVLRQYERAVMFTLGRYSGTRGPGLIFLVPWIQQIVRVDLRTVVIEVPSQDLITRDNVSVKVDAVLYFHVVDPEKSIIQVEQYLAATNMLAQTTLRSVLGQHELDELLAKRADAQLRHSSDPR
jgi:hypothetical protein